MDYDYDKVENILIQSIEDNLDLHNITGISVLNLFNSHYKELSLEQLYFLKPIDTITLPDGKVSVSIHDVFHYGNCKRQNVHRKLKFEQHFYGYFEHEVVQLRLELFYEPLDVPFSERLNHSFYEEVDMWEEKVGLVDIEKNEWFKQIKNDRPINYKLDVNFDA